MKKSFAVSMILGMLMVCSSVLAKFITPSIDVSMLQKPIKLENLIPKEFDGWKIDTGISTTIVSPDVKDEIEKLYTQTLSRTYINVQGERVMLSIAYGSDQRTDLQVHRPEICYLSSGFEVGPLLKIFLTTTIGQIPAMQIVARQGSRVEPITYWIRMGDSLTRGWFEQKFATFRYMMTGKIPDGLLFRISTLSNDEEDSFRVQQAFVTSLLKAVKVEDRHWLVGQLKPTLP